jgi:drug/metabolite transporter (DMT)-like permease
VSPRVHRWLPFFSLLMASLLWASSFIALKLAFAVYDPMVVIFARMALASLCFVFFLGRFAPVDYRAGDIKYLGFMALCEPCLYFIFEAKALQLTTASQAGMITAMLPLMVAVTARLFLSERISRRTTTGFIVAIAGTCWLSAAGKPTESAPNPALGNFLEFLAMVCAAGYMTTLKHLTSRYSPFFLTAVQAFVGAVFFFPVLFLPQVTLPRTLEPVAVASVIYLGTAITLGAYGAYNYGVSRIPASQASAFVNLIPVFTVIMGWLFLGETFTTYQYIAAGLVLLGVFYSQDRNKQEPAPLPQT